MTATHPTCFPPRTLGVFAGAVLLLLAAACSDDPAPAEIDLNPTSLSFDALGDSAVVRATVVDEGGRAMTGRKVEWTTGDPGVATVSSDGVVRAVGSGVGTILATSGRASATLTVTVQQGVVTLVAISEGSTSGTAGDPLSAPVEVEALDRLGVPVASAPLVAIVEAGGGSVTPGQVSTDASGRARFTWTLGDTAGTLQQLKVQSVDRPTVASFFLGSATAGPAAELVILSGLGQAGITGASLPDPVRVAVRDRLGNPRVGETVTFTVVSGGGSLGQVSATTDANGFAETTWTLGSDLGEQRIRVGAGALSVDGTATAIQGPAELVVVQGTGLRGTVGTPVGDPISVRLQTTDGTPIPDVAIRFGILSGGGTVAVQPGGDPVLAVLETTAADGSAALEEWILGPGAGVQEIEASFPGVAPLTISADAVASAAAALVAYGGDYQTGDISQPLADPLRIQVVDEFGNAVPGVAVDVQATLGGGSVTVLNAVGDAQGIVEAEWTLGGVLGLQSVTATSGAAQPLEMHAAGLRPNASGFNVEIRFLVPVNPSRWAVFQLAAARWSDVIAGDLPDVLSEATRPGQCGSGSPAVTGVVDDVIVLATVERIDTVGGILGSAGPCYIRDDSEIPYLGRMRLDEWDVERMEQRGTLQDVIIHEIGHILGIGTLWNRFGLLQDPSGETTQLDTYFSGAEARAAFETVGGSGYTGAKVPVENTGGGGTRNSHWRESVMNKELMTGYIDIGNPLSVVTVGSLQDMGYVVDLSAADDYSLPIAASYIGAPPEKLHLGNDIWDLPIRSSPVIKP